MMTICTYREWRNRRNDAVHGSSSICEPCGTIPILHVLLLKVSFSDVCRHDVSSARLRRSRDQSLQSQQFTLENTGRKPAPSDLSPRLLPPTNNLLAELPLRRIAQSLWYSLGHHQNPNK